MEYKELAHEILIQLLGADLSIVANSVVSDLNRQIWIEAINLNIENQGDIVEYIYTHNLRYDRIEGIAVGFNDKQIGEFNSLKLDNTDFLIDSGVSTLLLSSRDTVPLKDRMLDAKKQPIERDNQLEISYRDVTPAADFVAHVRKFYIIFSGKRRV